MVHIWNVSSVCPQEKLVISLGFFTSWAEKNNYSNYFTVLQTWASISSADCKSQLEIASSNLNTHAFASILNELLEFRHVSLVFDKLHNLVS